MATNWSAWYDDVIPSCPGVPLALATHEIRAAAIDFFRRSLAYQVELAAISSVAGQADYTLTSPEANTVIEQVLEVTYNGGEPLTAARRLRDLVAAHGAAWRSASSATPGYFYVNPQATSIKLVPKPTTSVTGAILVLAAVKPTLTAASLTSDDLYQQYRLPIAEGAKWRLMRMPRKPYSNPEQAAQSFALFMSASRSALARTMSGLAQSAELPRPTE